MPKAAPDTTVAPDSARCAPISPATSAPYVVAEREPTTATGDAELVESHRPAHPEPQRDCRPGPGPGRSGRGPPGPVGHSASPGTTKRMPRRSARSRSRAGSSSANRAATSVSTPPRSRSSARWRCTRSAPSSATSEASRGSPGSPRRPRASRASRSPRWATRPATALQAVTTRADARALPAPAARRIGGAAPRAARRPPVVPPRGGRPPSRPPGAPGWRRGG